MIESQYKVLLDKINSTKDFEAAKLAHEHFLSSLLSQSFVHMKTVRQRLFLHHGRTDLYLPREIDNDFSFFIWENDNDFSFFFWENDNGFSFFFLGK